MQLRPMTPEDTAVLEGKSISRGLITSTPEVIYEAFTLEHDGKILGSGGIRLIVPGTAWAWVEITPAAKDYIKTGYAVIVKWMEALAKKHSIYRLQAYVDLENEKAIRLVEHLGFDRESVMFGFLNGMPAGMYVRFYEVF